MKRWLSNIAELLVALAVAGFLGALRDLLARGEIPTVAPRAAEPSTDEYRARSQRTRMKSWLYKIAALVVVLGAGGFLVLVSGIVPIKASSGHWPITAFFLQFAKSRSVSTHTLGLEAPTLDDPSLVLKGATHYEIGCRPCHGSPELRDPRIAQQMTPRPPYLPPRVSNWEPDELFYIIKHGVKFTGMPAWPAQQRDDEVWAMVAFLRRFPELSEEEYRRLATGGSMGMTADVPMQNLLEPQQVPRAITENCGRCHGVDGRGHGTGAFPNIAGQRPLYLIAALRAYARGERHSGIMEPIAAGLAVQDIHEIALYYANLPSEPALPSRQTSAPAIERGEAIANQGIPRQRVPACIACHGPGNTPRNPIYPEIAGQYADYLALQLMLFKRQQRGGSPYAHLMQLVAARLTPEQIRDVTLYYASLSPSLDPSDQEMPKLR